MISPEMWVEHINLLEKINENLEKIIKILDPPPPETVKPKRKRKDANSKTEK